MSAQSAAAARDLVAALAEARKAQGITARDLAGRLNRSTSLVSVWENGSGFPPVLTLTAWAEELGLTLTVQSRDGGESS